MKWFLSLSACLGMLFAALGCGSGRQLQSVALTPTTADAQNFANGHVQFTATGTFSQKPSPVLLTSRDVGWCVGSDSGTCPGNIASGAIVDQNGLAQCAPNFTGTVTVLAGSGPAVTMPDGPSQLKIFGKAKLTCP
jgi:hypothetical protein